MNSSSPRPQIVDQEIRDLVLARDQSFIVQAPAGSGKTELLIQRFLNLLADPAVSEPESVLAITFTRKAAAEMRNRVRDALEAADAGQEASDAHEKKTRELASAVLARDAELGWQLLRDTSRLNIRTVDSLCEQIVHGGPLRAGFGARLSVTDDARTLYEEAARRTLLMLGGSDVGVSSALELLLGATDAQAQTLQALVAEMLQRRDQWLPILERSAISGSLRSELERSLAIALGEELLQIREQFSQAVGANLPALLMFARAAASEAPAFAALAGANDLPPASATALPTWQALREFVFTASHTVRKHVAGVTGKLAKDCAAVLESIAGVPGADVLCAASKRISRLPKASYSDAEWQRLAALFTVLPASEHVLNTVFAERGETDFIQIARAAVAALRDGGMAQVAGVRHILVDEFQDTSVLQVGFLRTLMSEWKARDGRTVFLVGDPMQSIYSFRKAEVTLFERARRREAKLLPREIEPREISVNFRSQQRLVEWFNATFAGIMTGANELTGGVGYVDAAAIHPPAERAVEARSFAFGDTTSEAEYVAAAIRRELDANPDPKFRVGILVRARSHLSQIVPALRRRGIPFRAKDIDALPERTAVRDLLALARALTHAGDRAAWLAVLRSPCFGLTLADLTALCGDRESQSIAVVELLRTRGERLSVDANARVARVLPVLESAIAQRGRTSLRELVEHTWAALGGPAAVRAGELGDSDLRDATAFFRFLDEHAPGGELPDERHLHRALEWLFSPPASSAGVRVELMTIHGAKGLQFDVVFVPGLDRPTRREGRALLYWRELVVGDAPQLLLAPFDPLHEPKHDEPTIAGYIRRNQADCAREERKRLVYVACTRAKQRLYLTFNRPKDKHEGSPAAPTPESFLALLDDVDSFNSIVQEGPDAAASQEPPQPNLRRLKADWAASHIERAFPSTAPLRPEREHTFEWVGRKQRAVGTVTHRFLQQIGRDGLDRWSEQTVRSRGAAIRTALVSEGLNESDLAGATAEVIDGLCAILAHDKGRWILAAHAEGECEFPLSGSDAGVDVRIRLDRTFVDDKGTRWIVDYKMATTTSTAVKAFLDQQQEKYRPDLERYARVMRELDPRPIRMGLYFPLLRAWREFEYAQPGGAQGSLFPAS